MGLVITRLTSARGWDQVWLGYAGRMRAWVLAVLAGFACWAQPADWAYRPLFSRDAAEGAEFRPLVETYCSEFHDRRKLRSVTFGHFLGPKSEDAVVSTSGCEPHTLLFGGSYVLTKREGKWVSLGYHAGMITEECHKLETGSGLEFLFCSHVMGAQGSISRVLRAYDFRTPKRPRVLFSLAVWNQMRAQDVDAFPVPSQGMIKSVDFADLDGDGVGDVSIMARLGTIERSDGEARRFKESGGRWVPALRVPSYRVEYLVQWDGLALTPRSVAAARLFPRE